MREERRLLFVRREVYYAYEEKAMHKEKTMRMKSELTL